MAEFRISSPAFQPNGTIAAEQIFDGWGCTGKNVSPELEWSGAPADAKSCEYVRRSGPFWMATRSPKPSAAISSSIIRFMGGPSRRRGAAWLP